MVYIGGILGKCQDMNIIKNVSSRVKTFRRILENNCSRSSDKIDNNNNNNSISLLLNCSTLHRCRWFHVLNSSVTNNKGIFYSRRCVDENAMLTTSE